MKEFLTKKLKIARDALAAAIGIAVEKSYVFYMELYCRHEGCPIREVKLHVKDHEGNFARNVSIAGLKCPLCQHQLSLHWVRTPAEQEADSEHKARMSVNCQMLKRDQL